MDFEKLGMFYLGKRVDPETGKLEKDLLLMPSKDLTTHAMCVGMTGSGKTGLGIALLEEAALDKIPAIVIDPKGDLGNLMLTFPDLSPEEFAPWTDPAGDENKAEELAITWKKGLATWGEDEKRIQKMRESVDIAIYTPASTAGIPISILSSFAAPTKEEMRDSESFRDKILSLTASLLGLIGVDANPIKSREFILVSSLIQNAWINQHDIDLATLINQVQTPPFDKMGALDLETFYPLKERMSLSISLNNLLASPGFHAWMKGAPLSIKDLLYTSEGKPKLSIISIAHLSDPERMFFVTLLLNEILSWTRLQPGTSSLRAIIYMDEIFGFFPPTAMPPSKLPMLSLLKQARAFGVGIVLATQNPVDLDYKGLANCGTWFIGKLQTERDKLRLMDGLKSATVQFDPKLLAMTGKRTFLMRSVHEKEPILFQTRWTMSYLYGPLTLAQIAELTEHPEEFPQPQPKKSAKKNKPHLTPGISELFVHSQGAQTPQHYSPRIVGLGKLHFVNPKLKIDTWQDFCIVAQLDASDKRVQWEKGENIPQLQSIITHKPIPGSTFADLPAAFSQPKNYTDFTKSLKEYLYSNQTLTLYQTSNLTSKPGETEADFHIRIDLETREKRDTMIDKIRSKYSTKINSLTEKIRKAHDKLAQKKQNAGLQKVDTMISVGSTIMGAIFGRKSVGRTISQTGTTLRKATKIGKEAQTTAQAEKDLQTYRQQLQALEDQMNLEITKLSAEQPTITSTTITPRKNDITIDEVALLWVSLG